MKKLLYFAAAAALVFGAVACNGNKEKVNEQGLVDEGGVKLTPNAQKSKIEDTANALMSDLDITVWEQEYDLVMNTVKEMQEKDVDASAIEEYLKGIVNAWTIQTGEDPHVVFETVIKLSQLKGHFTENANGSFDKEDADDLQVTIFSGNKTITATASVKDRDEKILLTSNAYETTDGYSEQNFEYINVPEKAALGITVDGKSLASLEIRLNFTDSNKNGKADESDKLDLGYAMTVGAYSLIIDQAEYATDAANVKMSFKRDNRLVLGVDAKAAAKVVTYDPEKDGRSGAEVIPVSATVKVDLEGKIQVTGNLPSGEALQAAQEEMNKAYAAMDYEAFKKAVDKFEKSFGVGVYYDGSNALQATLGFEPVFYQGGQADSDLNGDGLINEQDSYGQSFTASPVIRFLDGTTYSVEEYFSQDNFSTLMQKIASWAGGIEEYLGIK